MNNLVESEIDTMSVVTQGTAVTVVSTMSTHITSICTDMLPWFYVAIPLIALDLYYGRMLAKKEYSEGISKEAVTIQKSIKMTVQKIFNYIGWILLSCTLSLAFNAHYIVYIIMGLIYGIEVLSLINKWGRSKGIVVDEIGVLRLFCKYMWTRITGSNEGFEDVLRRASDSVREKGQKTHGTKEPRQR